MPNGPPSRFEWDDMVRRIDRMDERGTSGAASFQVRLEAVERELRDLRGELATEKRERKAGRRWVIGLAVTAAGVMSAVATFFAVFVFHAH